MTEGDTRPLELPPVDDDQNEGKRFEKVAVETTKVKELSKCSCLILYRSRVTVN
jgi:hypothetical protein